MCLIALLVLFLLTRLTLLYVQVISTLTFHVSNLVMLHHFTETQKLFLLDDLSVSESLKEHTVDVLCLNDVMNMSDHLPLHVSFNVSVDRVCRSPLF